MLKVAVLLAVLLAVEATVRHGHVYRSRKILSFSAASVHSLAHLNMMKVLLSSQWVPEVSDKLFPVVIISGDVAQIPSWLHTLHRNCSIILVHHTLSFAEEMEKLNLKPHPAFLRLDIPLIIESVSRDICAKRQHIRYDYCFYTDTDAIIMPSFNMKPLRHPRYVSIGPENVKGSMQNTGVMYMNVTAFRESHADIVSFGVSNKFNFSAFDQGLILKYFSGRINRLNDPYNWKPYWGVNDRAAIVHFHGPKPFHSIECITNYTKDWCSSSIENISALIPSCCRCPLYYKDYLYLLRYANKTYGPSFCAIAQSYSYYSSVVNHLFEMFQKRLDSLQGYLA